MREVIGLLRLRRWKHKEAPCNRYARRVADLAYFLFLALWYEPAKQVSNGDSCLSDSSYNCRIVGLWPGNRNFAGFPSSTGCVSVSLSVSATGWLISFRYRDAA